jgi:hypothetical protein
MYIMVKSHTNGNVALFKAIAEVLDTAPGIFATQ